MPEHWEYVFAAYMLWSVTFLIYWLYLARKSRSLERSIRRFDQGEGMGARGETAEGGRS